MLALAITATGAFAAWTDTKSAGDAILSSDWNAMVSSSWDTASGNVYRATGDVGIGTTDPNRKLHVADSTGVGYLQMTSSTSGSTATDGLELSVGTDASVWNYETGYLRLGTANSEALRISSAGNVGIGTTDPQNRMHLYGSNAALRLQDDNDANSYFTIDDASDTQTTINKYTNSGSTMIDINPLASDGTSNARVRLFRETNTTGAKGLQLLKGDGTATIQANIGVDGGNTYFNSGGNVGIGTTSPEGTLHALTGSAGTVTAVSSADDLIVENSGSGGISILTPDSADGHISFGTPSDSSGAFFRWNHDADLLSIATNNVGAGLAFYTSNLGERMRIDSSGNVGIGTTAPGDTLHVSGSGTTEVQIESTGADSDPALEIKNDARSWKIQTNGTESDILAIRDETDGLDRLVIHPTLGVGIGGYSATPSSLWVGDNAISVDSGYYGMRVYHIKTAGTTDDTDSFYGVTSTISMNDADSTIGHLYGGDFAATVSSGNVGIASSGDDLTGLKVRAQMQSSGIVSDEIYGSYVLANVDSGTIGGDIMGTYTQADVEAAVTSIAGSVYGHYVHMDVDKDPTGGAYGMWIRSLTNVDNAIYLDGTATAYCEAASCWTDASDVSLKENITDLDYGLEEVLAMQPRRYLYKPSNESTIGLVAQELDDIIPEVVTGEDGSMGIGYGNLTPVLVSALQDLKAEKDAEIAELTARIEALEMQN